MHEGVAVAIPSPFLEKGALICGRSPHIPLHFVPLVRSLRGLMQTAPFHGERLCRFCIMQNSYADSTLTQSAVLQTAIEKLNILGGMIIWQSSIAPSRLFREQVGVHFFDDKFLIFLQRDTSGRFLAQYSGVAHVIEDIVAGVVHPPVSYTHL